MGYGPHQFGSVSAARHIKKTTTDPTPPTVVNPPATPIPITGTSSLSFVLLAFGLLVSGGQFLLTNRRSRRIMVTADESNRHTRVLSLQPRVSC